MPNAINFGPAMPGKVARPTTPRSSRKWRTWMPTCRCSPRCWCASATCRRCNKPADQGLRRAFGFLTLARHRPWLTQALRCGLFATVFEDPARRGVFHVFSTEGTSPWPRQSKAASGKTSAPASTSASATKTALPSPRACRACCRHLHTCCLTTHSFHWNVTGPCSTRCTPCSWRSTELWNAVDPIMTHPLAGPHGAGLLCRVWQSWPPCLTHRQTAQGDGHGARAGRRPWAVARTAQPVPPGGQRPATGPRPTC